MSCLKRLMEEARALMAQVQIDLEALKNDVALLTQVLQQFLEEARKEVRT